MERARFEIAKPDILQFMNSLVPPVLARADFDKILANQASFWRLTSESTSKDLIKVLIETGKLKQIPIKFGNRNILRYIWQKASDFQVIQTLKPMSYFSHFTSMYLNNLTVQIPKILYLNYEQSPKHVENRELIQERIDYAFRQPSRVSKTLGEYNNSKICIINGMYTGQTGVVDSEDETGADIRITNTERTLIDITVRPAYAGGVSSVLEAFKLASAQVSVNKLAAYLSTINYIYPFHQAIGFYLEKSEDYNKRQIALLEKFEIKYDFYLTHNMKSMEYSKRWRLFYPKGL